MLEKLLKNQRRALTVGVTAFAVLLNLFLGATPAYALDTCNISLGSSPPSGGKFLIDPSSNENNAVNVSISGAIDNDLPANSIDPNSSAASQPNNFYYYVEIVSTTNGGSNSLNKKTVPISGGNSVGAINLADYFSAVSAGQKNYESSYTVRLKRNGGGGFLTDKTVCNSTFSIPVSFQSKNTYQCAGLKVNATRSGTNQINIATSATTSGLDPKRTYYVKIFSLPDLLGWLAPIPLGGGSTFDSSQLGDGNYVAYIVDNPNVKATSLAGTDIIPADHTGQCWINFTIEKNKLQDVKGTGSQVQQTFQDQNTVAANNDLGSTNNPSKAFSLCSQVEASKVGECNACLVSEDNPQGIWTAVGCINTSCNSIVGQLIKIGLSLAGGVAVLMILAAAFMLSTSQGEPKRTGEAKELLTSAIIGLLFIIFSVTILEFVGKDILQIPGFGEGSNCAATSSGSGLRNQQL